MPQPPIHDKELTYLLTLRGGTDEWRRTIYLSMVSMVSIDTAECYENKSKTFEPPHDKTNKMTERPANTQISLGIHPVWSETSLSAWSKLGSLATHWAHNEGSDQTGRMPRLIWVFAERTVNLLVLSWGGRIWWKVLFLCLCWGFMP